ncbi:MAG: phage portal protein [Acutalibacteraceae bacterium]|nr:phage portal protein [Acutalibacteraceae bacterium]
MNTNIFKRLFKNQKSETLTKYQLVTERGNGTYIWNGKIYDSDIVRACLAPYVKAIGKLNGKHIFDGQKDLKVNPEPYIKYLLEYPNPLMSAQKFQEKMAAQLILNGNAFASITRDRNGMPVELFPLPAVGVEADYKNGELYLKFTLDNGKSYTFNYDDIIHLRINYYDNDIFGNSLMPTLSPLLKINNTIDDGIVKAIKNSSLIRWLLKATSSIRTDDLKKLAKEFSESFLDTTSETGGVAATDSKVEAQQIDSKDYVPNFEILKSVKDRIYSLFGVSEKIVQGNYTEDEWNSFYESSIEPIAVDFANEYTRKLFTAKKRSYGNKIIFEASNLACATISTKLNFLQMVDRGALTPNEWREIFNLAPVEGGDEPIRRLDTRPTTEGGVSSGNTNQRNDNPE